ncbi:MAG TPA: 16S rRNA (adenine(1518)-N(6)/adenine(1519)-N(6))-dimethyltransferase RsmA [Spirochaetota bacterium]|nr:16S rRNA (adenine(1518)-N(6)/adenine(1519)-N(6))-dimethyltransferase RsmA [Spirochaetota bacterium]HPF07734.1 16S rRNA (adenine(1518)-N(6)/adenine(1519)-N(6))-dimethyltransferase RsmA [Spirochaetota bacterium]HPJ44445.1 16S rRNA (adenine(1518)-N(6)/adenine(1519)-N(6))-dimethyltransferase RsmA [Spirochaetota bacterium]
MNKSDIHRITEEYGLAPNKKLGQNFLINDDIIKRIVNACSPESRSILEIGPGLGAISRGLAERALSYTAVEIDSGFVRYLTDLFSGKGNVNVIHTDFLKSELDDRFDVIVSNLPYYCASEILFRIASMFSAPEVYGMMQKEMGDRIIAKPGSENYGALTVTLSYYFDAKVLFHVNGECFYPKPDVRSSFLAFKRKERVFTKADDEMFHLIVKSAFWGRRKTLHKSLAESPHLDFSKEFIHDVLSECGIDPGVRGEKLSLDEFVKLTEAIIKAGD